MKQIHAYVSPEYTSALSLNTPVIKHLSMSAQYEQVCNNNDDDDGDDDDDDDDNTCRRTFTFSLLCTTLFTVFNYRSLANKLTIFSLRNTCWAPPRRLATDL